MRRYSLGFSNVTCTFSVPKSSSPVAACPASDWFGLHCTPSLDAIESTMRFPTLSFSKCMYVQSETNEAHDLPVTRQRIRKIAETND